MVKMNLNDLSPMLSPEELEDLETAEALTPIFDEECPEMTEEMLHQFHEMSKNLVSTY